MVVFNFLLSAKVWFLLKHAYFFKNLVDNKVN